MKGKKQFGVGMEFHLGAETEMQSEKVKLEIRNGRLDDRLAGLYRGGKAMEQARERIAQAVESFEERYGAGRDIAVFSAPGRTEIGGNHTDHQGGRVLAAGINLDVIAVAAPSVDSRIRVKSKGFPEDALDAEDLSCRESEAGTSLSLLRGICAGFSNLGCKVGGFDAYTVSDVLAGSGLSSSAAFEVVMGTAVNQLFFGGKADALKIAQIGQYAENRYFGKPSGLMDQAASAYGGFTVFDFRSAEAVGVRQVHYDFEKSGCALCIVDTGGSHCDLTADYASIPTEMRFVAACFGKQILSEVDEAQFYGNLPQVRKKAGDRAVLRAIHYFAENTRVTREADALEAGRFDEFLRLITESGVSSFQYLQNVYPPDHPERQGLSLALALCQRLLENRGAWRVHGGGFAGTVLCFVPLGLLEGFTAELDGVFGAGACRRLFVRPDGGVRLI